MKESLLKEVKELKIESDVFFCQRCLKMFITLRFLKYQGRFLRIDMENMPVEIRNGFPDLLLKTEPGDPV